MASGKAFLAVIFTFFILFLILPKIPAHINSSGHFFIKDMQTKPGDIFGIRGGVNGNLYFNAVFRLFGFIQLVVKVMVPVTKVIMEDLGRKLGKF